MNEAGMTTVDALRLAITVMLAEKSRIERTAVPDMTRYDELTEAIELLTKLIVQMEPK